MPPRSDEQRMQDMIDSARRATSYVGDMTEAEFFNDSRAQDAVAWRLIVIGEAASRLPKDMPARIPELPWKSIINMRNRLVHEYESVRNDIVWATVSMDLQPMIDVLTRFLSEGANPSKSP
jgi:uncharacterized protein with HEPN domain